MGTHPPRRSRLKGRQIKAMLEEIGLETQKQRAMLCGVGPRTLRVWESQDKHVPLPVANAVRLARLVDCPPDGSVLDHLLRI